MPPLDSRKNTPVSSPSPASQALLNEQDYPPGMAADLCPLGLLLTRDRQIHWCNERFAWDFGYAKEDLLGEYTLKLYPSPTDFKRVGERGFKVLLNAGTYADERLMKLRDGSLRWFRVHGQGQSLDNPFQLASWVFEPLRTCANNASLTAREREVLSSMTRGLTAKEAAREMGLSPRTVEKLRAGLRQRYGVHNAAELMSRVAGLP